MTTTRLMRTRTFSAFGAAAALALTLAACSGGDSGNDDASPADASPTAEESASETASAEGDEPAAGSEDLASCVIGTWEMDTNAVKEEMAQMLGDSGGLEMTVEGYSRVTLDETTWTSDVDTTATFSMTVTDQTIDGKAVTTGTMVMDYVLEGDQLTQTKVVSAEGSAVTTVADQEQVVDFAEAADASVGLSQAVTCDATTMTLTAESEGFSMTQRYARK